MELENTKKKPQTKFIQQWNWKTQKKNQIHTEIYTEIVQNVKEKKLFFHGS
jgi:methionine salvage enolase-phosphatase E1